MKLDEKQNRLRIRKALFYAFDILLIILGIYFFYLTIGNNGMWGTYQVQGEFSPACWGYLGLSLLIFLITCTFLLVKLKWIHKLKYLRLCLFIVLLASFSLSCYLPAPTPLTDETGYYILRTPQSYRWFVNEINSGRSMPNVRLDRDLILNDTTDWEKWEETPPAQTYQKINKEYSGTFDGNGFIIRGYYSGNGSGLFRVLNETGVIKNLQVMESMVLADDSFDPGVICNYNEGLIEGCSSNAIVTGARSAGGVCGSNHGVITDTSFSGKVTAEECAGGIAGYNRGDISNCYNQGEIVSEGRISRSASNAGGICGHNGNESTIENCLNEGDITALSFAGGISGYNYYGLIKECRNTAAVAITADYVSVFCQVGGIVGTSSGQVIDSANSGKVYRTWELPEYFVCDSVYPIAYGVGEDSVITNCYYLEGSIEDKYRLRDEGALLLTQEQYSLVEGYISGEKTLINETGMKIFSKLPDNLEEMGLLEQDFISLYSDDDDSTKYVLKQSNEVIESISGEVDKGGFRINVICGWQKKDFADNRYTWQQLSTEENSQISLMVHIMTTQLDRNAFSDNWDEVSERIKYWGMEICGDQLNDITFQKYCLDNGDELYIYQFSYHDGDNDLVCVVAYRLGTEFIAEIIGISPAEEADRLEGVVIYSCASYMEASGVDIDKYSFGGSELVKTELAWEFSYLNNPFELVMEFEPGGMIVK